MHTKASTKAWTNGQHHWNICKWYFSNLLLEHFFQFYFAMLTSGWRELNTNNITSPRRFRKNIYASLADLSWQARSCHSSSFRQTSTSDRTCSTQRLHNPICFTSALLSISMFLPLFLAFGAFYLGPADLLCNTSSAVYSHSTLYIVIIINMHLNNVQKTSVSSIMAQIY